MLGILATTLAVGAVFLHTTLLDVEGDRRTGKRTTGVVLGPRATRAAAAVAAIAGWACAAGQRPILQLATGLLAILVWAALFSAARVTSRTVVVSATALFAIVAATFWPPFLLWIAFLVVATRVYYARRFALRYPAL
jgi:4-hydroxybenzoate polyprenyltransferase